ncbi:hypothetical protein KFL_018020010, partial [Klebsormidium nitens]
MIGPTQVLETVRESRAEPNEIAEDTGMPTPAAQRDSNVNVERYKSRLLAKGYLQKQGIGFEEVYAPVSKHTTLLALLAVVAERDLKRYYLDVKTAFLEEELAEEMYMPQPQRYKQ